MVEAFSTEVAELAQKAKVWRNAFDSRDQATADGIAFVRRVWDQASMPKAATQERAPWR